MNMLINLRSLQIRVIGKYGMINRNEKNNNEIKRAIYYTISNPHPYASS